MRKTYLIILSVLIMAMTASCRNCGKSRTPVLSAADSVCIEKFDSLFTEMFPVDAPGAAVLVLRDDDIIFDKGYGLADMNVKTPVDGKTMFNICSVSKQFSAVAVMKLAEDGKLSLDDPVSKFFPQFKADFFKEITLRHLMSHTSGIPDARSYEDPNFVHFATDEASYAYMDTLDFLNFEPGTQYEYENPTFQLLYTVISKCSGIPFDKYMRDSIFTPASMPRAVYFEAGKDIHGAAHGYRYDATKGWVEYDYGEASFFATKADGGLYTSTEEFVQWEKALRNNLIITAADRDTMQSEKIMCNEPDLPYTGYGYGWFIERKPGFPKKVFHTGNNGGFQIFEGMFPEQKIQYLIFATRDDWDREATVAQLDEYMKSAGWLGE
jgi:Beta-lactamase class C and other penicillin binding proteins